jgi:hypothetical protein
MNNENLTIHVKVKDFSAWRSSYNGHEKDRVSAGITNSRVFRSPEDPNDVVILQDVADVSKARTWLTSNEMKSVMEMSGVLGSPSIRFAAAA